MGRSAGAGRIYSLDGLRAISISLVLVYHLVGTRGFPLAHEDDLPFDVGNFGVVVFFVISGYLITTLLLGELGRRGTISLRRFYFRRTARIFPPYYAYIFVMLALTLVGIVSIPARDFACALTYTSNFIWPSWHLAHTWSLAVEEQFYLLWPATLWLLGTRRAFTCALVFVLAAPVFRVATWRAGVYHGALFPAVGDSIACGCLLAGWRSTLEAMPRYMAFLRSRAFILVPAILVGVLWARHWIFLSHLAFQSLENVLIAVCLHYCLLFPAGAFGRLLNSQPLVFVGRLSYSLYLVQQPFLQPGSGSAFPINLVACLAAALACYYGIERPVLEWRDRSQGRDG